MLPPRTGRTGPFTQDEDMTGTNWSAGKPAFGPAPNLVFDPRTVSRRAAVADVLPPAMFNRPASTEGQNLLPPVLVSARAGAPAGVGAGASASGLTGAKPGAGTGTGAVGKNSLNALNAALGLAGVIEYATAKAPKLPGRPDAYAPVIRPAQGLNVTSLEAGRRGIQSAQALAGRATVDTGTTALTRLLAQQQAGEQQAQLSLKDNEAFQADQKREDDQRLGVYDANYKTQRSYDERVYDVNQRQYEGRRQQAAGMSQAALSYFTQSQAAKQQARQIALESKNRQAESQLAQYRALPWATMSPETRAKSLGELDALEPTGGARKLIERSYPAGAVRNAQGGKLPALALLARGGKVGTRASAIKPLPNSVDSHHDATREFGQQMQRITSQAMQAFQSVLSQASAKRARGLRA